MIIVRKSEERRQVTNKDHKTWMTFDLENKSDSLHQGFGLLKILNEELLSPGSGFILHTHQDLVVITYLLEGVIIYKGSLEKSDFMENKDFQKVDVTPDTKQYAFNVSQTDTAHVIQAGFKSGRASSKPNGVKKLFTHAERQGNFKLIASPDGREGSLPIEQDVFMYSTFVNKGNHLIHELSHGRSAWLHVVKGQILMDNLTLQTGDGAGLSEEMSVSFTARMASEILLFDLGVEIADELKTDLKKKQMAGDLVETVS